VKKIRLPCFLALCLGLLYLSCYNDPTGPEPTLHGSWVRDLTDAVGVTFTAELRFNNDNSYDFLLLTDAPGHTESAARFTLSGHTMTITVDADCPGMIGIYDYVASAEALALVGVEDACGPRQAALQGVWDKK
jgi:hypothetical protein